MNQIPIPVLQFPRLALQLQQVEPIMRHFFEKKDEQGNVLLIGYIDGKEKWENCKEFGYELLKIEEIFEDEEY